MTLFSSLRLLLTWRQREGLEFVANKFELAWNLVDLTFLLSPAHSQFVIVLRDQRNEEFRQSKYFEQTFTSKHRKRSKINDEHEIGKSSLQLDREELEILRRSADICLQFLYAITIKVYGTQLYHKNSNFFPSSFLSHICLAIKSYKIILWQLKGEERERGTEERASKIYSLQREKRSVGISIDPPHLPRQRTGLERVFEAWNSTLTKKRDRVERKMSDKKSIEVEFRSSNTPSNCLQTRCCCSFFCSCNCCDAVIKLYWILL